MNIRIGVIGMGIGEIAMGGYLDLQKNGAGVELAAVCDINPDKKVAAAAAYRKYGLEPPEGFFYTDYSRMFACVPLDGVYIAVPNWLHEPVTLAALGAGLHVHLEKPMAHTLESARRIHDAWQRSGLIGLPQLNNCYRPEVEMIKEAFRYNELGTMQSVKCWWCRRHGIPFYGEWFTDMERSGGGPLVDLAPHIFGVVFDVLGWPVVNQVIGYTWDEQGECAGFGPYGGGRRNENGKFDVERRALINLRTVAGIPIDAEVAWAMHCPVESMGFCFVGSHSTIEMNRIWPANDGSDVAAVDSLRLYTDQMRADRQVSVNSNINADNDPSAKDPLMGRTVTPGLFVEAIMSGVQPRINLNHLYRIQQVIDAAYRSAEGPGDPIALEMDEI